MPTIEEEFATLSTEFLSAFGAGSGAATGTLSRNTEGTFNPATGTAPVTAYAAAITYARHGDARIEQRITAGGEQVKFEVVEYYIDRAELEAAPTTIDGWQTGANAAPRIDDSFTEAASPNGDGKTRRIVEVRLQLAGKGYKLRTETLLTV